MRSNKARFVVYNGKAERACAGTEEAHGMARRVSQSVFRLGLSSDFLVHAREIASCDARAHLFMVDRLCFHLRVRDMIQVPTCGENRLGRSREWPAFSRDHRGFAD